VLPTGEEKEGVRKRGEEMWVANWKDICVYAPFHLIFIDPWFFSLWRLSAMGGPTSKHVV
jgi:hypothetical protein